MATLAGMGVHYTNAKSAMPSDSFPGLLAFVTGGSPKSTGVYYDDSYDRLLSAAALEAATAELHIAQVLVAARIGTMFGDAMTESRVPDLMILPQEGVIYTKPIATKIAEHGGFSEGDVHVPVLVAGPGIAAATVNDAVATMSIAPTILAVLGMDPMALQAVKAEGAAILPGLGLK